MAVGYMLKFKDLTNNRYGRLVVLEFAGRDKTGNILWKCLCDCNQEVIVTGSNLTNNSTKSCGCLRKEIGKSRIIDLTGQVFGRLTVMNLYGSNKTTIWSCKCECGNYVVIPRGSLISGRTKSCGCLNRKLVSERNRNKIINEQERKRLSNIRLGTIHSEETKQKMSESRSGMNSPNYGKTFPPEIRKRMSDGYKYHAPRLGKHLSEESKQKISINRTGKRIGPDHPLWKGGCGKYCYKFNDSFRKQIRNKFNRRCFICDTTEEYNIEKHGEKLSIHHIDYDKLDICNGRSWPFVPLCKECHSKSRWNKHYYFNLLINYWINKEEICLDNEIFIYKW
jgi:hypothetical protein